MSKRKRRDAKTYKWENKPVTFNTKTRWQSHGYRPRKDVTLPCGVLYNNYGKACDLFNKSQVADTGQSGSGSAYRVPLHDCAGHDSETGNGMARLESSCER